MRSDNGEGLIFAKNLVQDSNERAQQAGMKMRLRLIEEQDTSLLDETDHVGRDRDDESLPGTQATKQLITIGFVGCKFSSRSRTEQPIGQRLKDVDTIFGY